jgi:hypothetical protein
VNDGNRKVLIVIAGLALCGLIVMLGATRFGVGIPPDATVYLDAAHNLGTGHGLVVISRVRPELVPLTHYPPLFSALLALVSAGGPTLETAARWLNAILFGINIFLIGLALAWLVRDSFWLPVMGSFLTLTAPDLLANHSIAMTEPLYLALTLAGFLSLAAYLKNERRWLLVLSASCLALSVLTRYVGIAGVVTGSVVLLFLERKQSAGDHFGTPFSSKTWRHRVSDTLIFVLITCAPLAMWSIRNRLLAGGASDRQLAFHPVKFQQIVAAFSAAAQWLLLGKVRLDVRAVAFIVEVTVMFCLAIYLFRKPERLETSSREASSKLPHILITFVILYLGLLLFTITFFEIDNVLDSRSLLPVHFSLLILGPFLANRLYRRAPVTIATRCIALTLTLLLAGSYAFRGARWLAGAQADGQGYASRSWKESLTVAQLRTLPADSLIYSNGVDVIYYLTGKRAREIPAKIIHGTAQPNPNYDVELQRMSDDLRQHHGVLVYFNTLPERWFLPLESELQSELPLNEIATEVDGSVFELGSARTNPSGH